MLAGDINVIGFRRGLGYACPKQSPLRAKADRAGQWKLKLLPLHRR